MTASMMNVFRIMVLLFNSHANIKEKQQQPQKREKSQMAFSFP
jgi:hypothetical protein